MVDYSWWKHDKLVKKYANFYNNSDHSQPEINIDYEFTIPFLAQQGQLPSHITVIGIIYELRTLPADGYESTNLLKIGIFSQFRDNS